MVALDPHPTSWGGEAPKEAPLLDLEVARPEGATWSDCMREMKKKKSSPAAAFTEFFAKTREEADRVAPWALRVFLVALWLYLVNLMRQFVIASGTGESRACTAAGMVLVAFSLGGMFCVLGTAEGEHTDGGGVPKPAPRPSSSRQPGWTLSPNLLLCHDDDDDDSD